MVIRNATKEVERIERVINVLVDNRELAGLVGKTVADWILRRKAYEPEEQAQLEANRDRLAAELAVLDAEISR